MSRPIGRRVTPTAEPVDKLSRGPRFPAWRRPVASPRCSRTVAGGVTVAGGPSGVLRSGPHHHQARRWQASDRPWREQGDLRLSRASAVAAATRLLQSSGMRSWAGSERSRQLASWAAGRRIRRNTPRARARAAPLPGQLPIISGPSAPPPCVTQSRLPGAPIRADRSSRDEAPLLPAPGGTHRSFKAQRAPRRSPRSSIPAPPEGSGPSAAPAAGAKLDFQRRCVCALRRFVGAGARAATVEPSVISHPPRRQLRLERHGRPLFSLRHHLDRCAVAVDDDLEHPRLDRRFASKGPGTLRIRRQASWQGTGPPRSPVRRTARL